jgi:hypothetical protein
MGPFLAETCPETETVLETCLWRFIFLFLDGKLVSLEMVSVSVDHNLLQDSGL